MKTAKIELKKSELNYLISLVEDNIRSGDYYGNYEQFIKWQNSVKKSLQIAMDELTSVQRRV